MKINVNEIMTFCVIGGTIALLCFVLGILDLMKVKEITNQIQQHSTDSTTIHTFQAQHLADSIRIEYLDGVIVDSLNEVK